MRVAPNTSPDVHLILPDTRSPRLQHTYACGLCWPRELWGNIRAPRDTTDKEKATCPDCLTALKSSSP